MWLEGDNKRGVWGIQWRSDCRLDGRQRYLIWGHGATPLLFRTRRAAQKYIDACYGDIRSRPDLRAEPFGWKMPRPIKVVVRWKEQDCEVGK